MQPWPAPRDLKVTSYLACAAGEKESVPTWSGGEAQGHPPDVGVPPQEGEEGASTQPTAELEGARGEEQGGFKHTAAGKKNTCQKRDLL